MASIPQYFFENFRFLKKKVEDARVALALYRYKEEEINDQCKDFSFEESNPYNGGSGYHENGMNFGGGFNKKYAGNNHWNNYYEPHSPINGQGFPQKNNFFKKSDQQQGQPKKFLKMNGS